MPQDQTDSENTQKNTVKQAAKGCCEPSARPFSVKALSRRIADVADAAGPVQEDASEFDRTETLRNDLADAALAQSIVREAVEAAQNPKAKRSRKKA